MRQRVTFARAGPGLVALQPACAGVQRQRFAGHPDHRRAQAGPGVAAGAGKAVPVPRAGVVVDAGGQRALVSAAGETRGVGGVGAVEKRPPQRLRVDPDRTPRGVGVEVLQLQQRPALGQRLVQRAAGLLLHHVVGPEAEADVPRHHLLAGAGLPGVGVPGQGQRVGTQAAVRRAAGVASAPGQRLQLQRCRPGAAAAAQQQLGGHRVALGRRQAGRLRVGRGQQAGAVGRARLRAQPPLAAPCGQPQAGVGVGRGVGRGHGGSRAAGNRGGRRHHQGRHQRHRRQRQRRRRVRGRPHSRLGLRARNIGFSQASGTLRRWRDR
jgi:hypothetical protein